MLQKLAEDFLARDCRDRTAPVGGEASLGLIEPEWIGIVIFAHAGSCLPN
jgi:hypothetical protein